MKRNANLHNHGQGKVRSQEAIGELKINWIHFLKNGFAWNLDQGPCLFFAELFSGMQMNSDIKA